ncbi:helix-turn-helix transcriptional regulator [Neobacillus sp. NPDC093127]|uniref:helix-turn-helix transcriptional regulator n=1 Tax=Neobacillus sp. NPDC093127 TaxID=3364296 RepID=UPI003808F13A
MRIINLIQNSPGIKATELAKICEVSERSIYRDLIDLSEAGIPVTSNEGRGNGYTFASNFAMYPLDWTQEEAMAFSLLPGVAKHSLIQTNPHFQTAYEKVMAAYNKEQRNQQQNISKLVDLIQFGKPQNKVETSNQFLLPIAKTMVKNQTLKVKYETKSRDEINERFIDPYYLIPRESKFYILAYCHKREDFRTFRLSRFLKVEETNRIFTKKQLDLQKYFQNTWSIIKGDKEIHFKVRFNKNVARYVMEKEIFATPKLTEYDDGSLLFEITLNHDEEFLKWVRQYGPDAEIIEPVEYRIMMQKELRKWAEMYK